MEMSVLECTKEDRCSRTRSAALPGRINSSHSSFKIVNYWVILISSTIERILVELLDCGHLSKLPSTSPINGDVVVPEEWIQSSFVENGQFHFPPADSSVVSVDDTRVKEVTKFNFGYDGGGGGQR
jgi:hypothetical protein